MKLLTKEQERVFNFVLKEQKKNGAPPTIREICSALGYKSVNNARQHLKLIEQKGYLKLIKGRSRGIEIIQRQNSTSIASNKNELSVPLIGNIAAGIPIMAEENIEAEITLDKTLFNGDHLFTLRVKGDSMKDIGVLNGDIAIIKQQNTANNGDIIAAIINGEEATLKRFIKEENRVILRPENVLYDDIIVSANQNFWVAGKMIGILRKC